MLTVEEISKRMAPLFRDKALSLVLLFGSAATGRIHPRSDIDLGFLSDKPIDLLRITNETIRLLKSDDVDVVDLRRASPLLKISAARDGKVLYERVPGIFADFYSLAFRMYVDTRKLRDAKAESIKLFLASRGL